MKRHRRKLVLSSSQWAEALPWFLIVTLGMIAEHPMRVGAHPCEVITAEA